jgi:aminopeptidase-like protein
MIGQEIHDFAGSLWNFNRSITGDGVRETLRAIQNILPNLEIKEYPTGMAAFDWTVPKEWIIREAWIKGPDGEFVCEFSKNNLHLVGYSTPIHERMTLRELQTHLHSLPEQPTAIPYITSYYKENWGFCISENVRNELQDGEYEVYVDSELIDGHLTYGELVIPGESSSEVLLSTYVCHPSMANNELSGPSVTTYLAKWLSSRSGNRLTYRILFIPETIGSIAYISQNLEELQSRVIAGFNITCIGDDRNYSYLPSRNGETLSDKVAVHVLTYLTSSFKKYPWAMRGSDERQYCAPGVDLPIASIMRTRYGDYPEYHTSLDNLIDVVTPNGLEGGFTALKCSIEAIEANSYPLVKVLCEPQLGKRGLYPNVSTKTSGHEIRLLMNVITWSDGKTSLIEIADLCKVAVWDLYPIVETLVKNDLIELLEIPLENFDGGR